MTFSHSSRTRRYGCPHDGVVGLTVPARFTLLVLAGAFTFGACSGLAGDGFAVVPGTPRAGQDRRDTARATPTLRATPTPRQTARPRATPKVLPSPSR